MTAVTITDPVLLAKIAEAKDYLELRDPNGFCIGRVQRDWYGKLPPGAKSHLSDEEFERRQREPEVEDKSLSEIFGDLERRFS